MIDESDDPTSEFELYSYHENERIEKIIDDMRNKAEIDQFVMLLNNMGITVKDGKDFASLVEGDGEINYTHRERKCN